MALVGTLRHRMATRQKGAFVYSGSGRKQPEGAPPEQIKCKDDAIRVQRCLARNNHQQKRCTEEVDAWKGCCVRVKEAVAAQSAQQQQQLSAKPQ